MRIILSIVKKEFLQIFRNKILSKIIFIAPVIQLVVLVYAANFEVENISLGIIDRDGSQTTTQLQQVFTATDYFKIKPIAKSYTQALKEFESDDLDVIIEIPAGFERDMINGTSPRIAIFINSINSMKAGVASSYVGGVISEFGKKQALYSGNQEIAPVFELSTRDWYNPRLDYKSFMISGILCVLITIIGILLTALNIVREKEVGTIEQLNVTPISKTQFIIGKLLPFGIIGIIQLTLGIIVALVVFDFKIEGSIPLVYFMVSIYLVGILGVGFLISTSSDTQAQAMFTTIFCMFLFILMGGLFTPIDSMPTWARYISDLNPTKYLIESVRMIMLKGSGFADVKNNIAVLSVFALIINATVIFRYRKIN